MTWRIALTRTYSLAVLSSTRTNRLLLANCSAKRHQHIVIYLFEIVREEIFNGFIKYVNEAAQTHSSSEREVLQEGSETCYDVQRGRAEDVKTFIGNDKK